MDLDVRRHDWLQSIKNVLATSTTCVVRSASGQGKLSIVYRYAFENWDEVHTFELRVAESSEQVETIRGYLRFRTSRGWSTHLLVEDGGTHVRLWPKVVQECAALGIKVIVAVRHEDWFRIGRDGLFVYGIVEPSMTLEKARGIFVTLRKVGRVNATVQSAAWAYERIGEPHLLMEYVYLLTLGRLLEDRLRDQLQQMSDQGEDQAKFEILRRVSLAASLGLALNADALIRSIPTPADGQRLLLSLQSEYLRIEGNKVLGLHWVRSDHLARLLHEGYPNQCHTALTLFDLVDQADITVLVSSAMAVSGLDIDRFLSGLVDRAACCPLEESLRVLDGLFSAGEERLLLANRSVLDEAHALLGWNGVLAVSCTHMPMSDFNIIDRVAETAGYDRNDLPDQLAKLSRRFAAGYRGLDQCHDYLLRIELGPRLSTVSLGAIGRLLNWYAICNVRAVEVTVLREFLKGTSTWLDLDIDDFCSFAQGLFRYDAAGYTQWRSDRWPEIVSYLRFHLKCSIISLSDDVVSVGFLPDLVDLTARLYARSVTALQALRSVLPFCKRYQAQQIQVPLFGWWPAFDESHKDIPTENLPLESDVAKNALWLALCEALYAPDTYREFEEAWHGALADASCLVQMLSGFFTNVLQSPSPAGSDSATIGQATFDLQSRLTQLPRLPARVPMEVKQSIEDSLRPWSVNIASFARQLPEYLSDTTDEHKGRLAVLNLSNAARNLAPVADGFAQLFRIAPNYFDITSESVLRRRREYEYLASLVRTWAFDRPPLPVPDINAYMTRREVEEEQARLTLISDWARGSSLDLALPIGTFEQDDGSRGFVLGFSVPNPFLVQPAVEELVRTVPRIKDTAAWFYLVPLYHEHRFLDGAYRLSSIQLAEVEEGRLPGWELLVPLPLPEEASSTFAIVAQRDVPEFTLMARFFALLGQVEVLARWERELNELPNPVGRFDDLVSQRYHAELESAARALLDKVSDLASGFETDWPERPDLQPIADCLGLMKNAIDSLQFARVLASGLLESEAFRSAIERLMSAPS